jgi:hypothetical protein
LEEIFKYISKQVLETKYTFNLGQMLWVTPDIKHYKLNSITSKPTLLKPSLAIDHQMAMT